MMYHPGASISDAKHKESRAEAIKVITDRGRKMEALIACKRDDLGCSGKSRWSRLADDLLRN